MKYRQLIREDVAVKLLDYAFNTRQKDREVFNYVQQAKDEYAFYNNEMMKFRELPRAEQESAFKELMDSDVKIEIVKFNLSYKDFEDGNCRRPMNHNNWLTEREILSIVEWCKENPSD